MNGWVLFPENLAERLATTLLHFFWQGAAVVLVILLLGWLLRVQRSASRYALFLLGLMSMAACPVGTFFVVSSGPNSGPSLSQPVALLEPGEPPTRSVEPAPIFVAGPRFSAVPAVIEKQAAQPQWLRAAQGWIVWGWMLGVTILGSRLLVGWLWLRWLRWRLEPVPSALTERAVALCRALRLRLPRLRACRQIHEAIATGLLRPLILFPVAWLTELPPDMLEAVLAHELAHLYRWDLWVNALQRFIEVLLFYHPAVWWLSRRLRIERELCCDELAVSLIHDRLRYAQTLERVGRLVVLGTSSDLALTIGGKQMTLLLRVTHLLGPRPTRLSPTPWLAGLAALVLPIAVWWFALSAPVAHGLAAEHGMGLVTATVVDSANKPVPGVEVQVYKNRLRVKPPFRTDAKGQFRVPRAWRSSEAEDYTLVVRDQDRLGWFDFYQNLTTGGQELAFRIQLLSLDQTVQGTLVDEQGKPLAGVPVGVSYFYDETNHYASAGRFGKEGLIRSTPTDQKGRFRIEVPAGTQGELQPRHRDWLALRIRWKPGQNDLGRIQLGRAGRIEGHVVDALAGKPLRGVLVGAQAYNQDSETGGWGDTLTDAKGEFLIGGLRPGQYNALFLGRPGDCRLTAPATEAVNVQIGKPARVEFRASTGRLLAGKVLDTQTGKPLEQCHVGYYGSARPRSGAACMMVQTDAQGEFHFYVPPGLSYVYVADGRRLSNADSQRTLEVPADRDPEPVVLKAGALRPDSETCRTVCITPEQEKKQREDRSYRLQGVLRTSDSRPVTKVDLRLVYEGSRHTSMWMGRAGSTFDVPTFQPDDDGRKAFLLVDAEGFAPARSATFTVARSMPPLTIDLKPAVHVPVRGRVLDQQGRPVAGARIRVGQVINFQEEQFPWGLETTTDAMGRFELNHLRVGDRFYIRADKPGTGGAQSERIFIEKKQPANLQDLIIGPPNQTIHGQVTDYDGEAVAGAKITFQGETVVATTADAGGRFELKGLPTGKLSLAVSAPGHESRTCSVLAGAVNAKLYIGRQPPPDREAYRLQVQLRPKDGKTVRHTQIWLLNKDEERLLSWSQFQGNEYEFNMEREYRRKLGKTFAVVVAAEGYAQPEPVPFTARKNAEPVVIDLQPAAAATLHGRVVSEQGEPIAGVRVGLSRSLLGKETDEPWRYINSRQKLPMTDTQGRFQIPGISPGSRIAVYVNKPGYAGTWSARIKVPDHGDVRLPDLVLKKATREVTGRVLSPKGQPVAGARVSIHDLGPVETATDVAGRFHLRAVPEKAKRLIVDAPDFEIAYKELAVGESELTVRLTAE
jgi:beta-lactamase regulating signal transducer with metallopeptidase domain/protocatechuate 3,4-dioxygenase beta subunit/3-methyladenine DNA glycosylase Mpg